MRIHEAGHDHPSAAVDDRVGAMDDLRMTVVRTYPQDGFLHQHRCVAEDVKVLHGGSAFIQVGGIGHLQQLSDIDEEDSHSHASCPCSFMRLTAFFTSCTRSLGTTTMESSVATTTTSSIPMTLTIMA